MSFKPSKFKRLKRPAKPADAEEWQTFCQIAAKLELAKEWLKLNPRPRCPTVIAFGNLKPQLSQHDIDIVTSDFNTFFHSEEIGKGEDLSITTQPDDDALPAASDNE